MDSHAFYNLSEFFINKSLKKQKFVKESQIYVSTFILVFNFYRNEKIWRCVLFSIVTSEYYFFLYNYKHL